MRDLINSITVLDAFVAGFMLGVTVLQLVS